MSYYTTHVCAHTRTCISVVCTIQAKEKSQDIEHCTDDKGKQEDT